MKVLFDTNVYVSESLGGRGARSAIRATVDAAWRIYASEYICDETERVLVDDLRFAPTDASAVRRKITRRARLVCPPASRHHVPHDPWDSPILRAALDAGVDYLVSNDRHLLDLRQYESVRIISLDQYLRLLVDAGALSE